MSTRMRQLRFLLVGDEGVGKHEFLDSIVPNEEQPGDPSVVPRETKILRDGKPVRIQIWYVPPGRFKEIYMTSGCSGIIFFFDITKKETFHDVKNWIDYVDENTPYQVPRLLIGNRLHLEFDRQVTRKHAEHFATKRGIRYYEVSTLAFFNVEESLGEMARQAISRFDNFYKDLIKRKDVPTLREICSRVIGAHLTNVHFASTLPLPQPLQGEIRSFVIGDRTCTCAPLPPARYRNQQKHKCTIM